MVDATDASRLDGHARIDPAAMHGNRWPALYGGFLFDLAYRACALATSRRLQVLELHFLRAVRRADVSERDGLTLAWRVSRDAGREATVELGDPAAPLVYGVAVLDDRPDTPLVAKPEGARLVLPAHDADWRAGLIKGRCLELPGSLPAIADTLLAKAMSTVRGDDCPDDEDEHYLVRTLSYWWIEPVDDALATFEARVIQRGRRMALAVGTLAVDGHLVGRTTGTVAIQRVARKT